MSSVVGWRQGKGPRRVAAILDSHASTGFAGQIVLCIGQQGRGDVAPRGTYRRIAEEIRRRIGSGELLPGSLVASEMALVKEHRVSRGTVRAALALLVDEGLVEVVPGQGRRVVGQAPSVRPATAYERIAHELQERLDAGEFGPSTPLPSESELVAAYGVSRNTARRAYQHLAESGAVVIRHGAGAFPAPR